MSEKSEQVNESISHIASARLEGLRGIAAMVVAMFHTLFLVKSTHIAIDVFNGRSAVSLFFVLSGFVLGLSFRRQKEFSITSNVNYGWKRIRRICPALIVMILVSWLLLEIFPSSLYYEGIHWWPGWLPNFHGSMNYLELAKNLFLVDSSLNIVTWSLRAELIGSFFLIVCVGAERFKKNASFFILALVVMTAFLRPHSITLASLIPFVIGYILPNIISFYKKYINLNWINMLAIFGIGALLLLWPRSYFLQEAAVTSLESVGSGLLIVMVVTYDNSGKGLGLLGSPVMLAAGRLSYSYYLYHPLVLFWGVSALSLWRFHSILERLNFGGAVVVWLITSIVAFSIAQISFKLVEKPFMARPKRTEILIAVK